MLKILPVDKIREADAYTIANEPIDSVDLMERAAAQCFRWLKHRELNGKRILIFCGVGNNGGDGLAIARMLLEKGYSCNAYVIWFSEKSSYDFAINYERLKNTIGNGLTDIYDPSELPELSSDDLVIDAIFGSGLSKPVMGLAAKAIEHINKCGAVVISIDIPSGLFSDSLPVAKDETIIKADYTLTFEFPKLSFFFHESEMNVGEWSVLSIGLHADFIRSANAAFHLTEDRDIYSMLKVRTRFSHKGKYGHALLIAGSIGKMGAAVLASKACLRTGAGLLTTHVPQMAYEIMQMSFPEAMVSVDESKSFFTGIKQIENYNSIAIGPGLGMNDETGRALKLLIQFAQIPLIVDADAINLLGENKTWLSFLPPGSILTPHPREFERITAKAADSLERNKLQIDFSVKYQVYLILKGAHTCISTPQGTCYFNPTGNPGMATAGSGDVLTGILAGLLAQGYTPLHTCLIGTYIHGLAGDLVAKKTGYEALIASDIIDHIGKAFKKVRDTPDKYMF